MKGWTHMGFLLIGVSVTVGCGKMKAYDGPELPRDKVALIMYKKWGYGRGLRVVAVDGMKLDYWDKGFVVKPGKHSLAVYTLYDCRASYPSYATSCSLTPVRFLLFEVEANHTYRVHLQDFRNPRYWIEDETTHQVVGRYPE